MVDTSNAASSQDEAHRDNRTSRLALQVLKILKKILISRGFTFGIAFSALTASLAFAIGSWFGNMLESLLFDMDLFGITPAWTLSRLFALLTFLYSFCMGFQTVDTAHAGIPVIFDMRLKHVTFEEGLAWWFPKPIGKILTEDMRTQPLDIAKSEILTRDGVAVNVDVSLVYQIVNLFQFINTANPREQLKNEALDQLRYLVGKCESKDLYNPEVKKDLNKEWLYGELKRLPETEEEKSEAKGDDRGLWGEVEEWGLAITKAQISNIRLPESIEQANADKEVEEAQKVSERTEATHTVDLMQIYMDKGLTAQEALNAMQAERGKATRIIIEGGASDLVKAGALIGGIVDHGDSDHSSRSGGKPPFRNRRRQPNK